MNVLVPVRDICGWLPMLKFLFGFFAFQCSSEHIVQVKRSEAAVANILLGENTVTCNKEPMSCGYDICS